MMFSQKSGHFVAVWLTRAPDCHGGVQVHGGQGHSRTRGSVPAPLRGRFPRRVGPPVAVGWWPFSGLWPLLSQPGAQLAGVPCVVFTAKAHAALGEAGKEHPVAVEGG